MRKNALGTYILFLLIPLAVGGASALLTGDSMAAYERLKQPPLAPPGLVFPVVWTVLYLLMGFSAALVWRSGSPRREDAVFTFGAQLFVNFWWTILFFRLEVRLASFFWLLLLVALVAVMIVRFWRIRPVAGILNLPYLAWLLFASYLNLAVFLLNK